MFSSNMGNVIDGSIVIILIFFAIQGFRKGIILEFIGIANIFISLFITYKFSYMFSNLFGGFFGKGNILSTMSPIVVFILSYILLNVLVRILNSFLVLTPVNNLNKAFGSLFGFVKCIMFLCLIMLILIVFDANKRVENRSTLLPYVSSVTQTFFDLIPPNIKNSVLLKKNQVENVVNQW